MAVSTECLKFLYVMNMHKFWVFPERKESDYQAKIRVKKKCIIISLILIFFIGKQGQTVYRSEVI